MFYVALEPGLEGAFEPELEDGLASALHGNTSELGSFIVRCVPNQKYCTFFFTVEFIK